VKDFSKLASISMNLLKKTAKFEWTDRYEKAFRELRHCLTTAPILTLLVEGNEYTVYSDVLKNGLGCVLIKKTM